MPLTATWVVVVVTEQRADLWSSPLDAGSSFITGLCISRYGCTETLTISTTVTSTGVAHTSIIKHRGVHPRVAGLECGAVDDAALFLGPGRSIGVGCTRIDRCNVNIRTGG